MAEVGDYVIRTIDINGREVAVRMSADIGVGDYCILTRDVNGRLIALKPGGDTLAMNYATVDEPGFSTTYLGDSLGSAGYNTSSLIIQKSGGTVYSREVFIELAKPVADGGTVRVAMGSGGVFQYKLKTDNVALTDLTYEIKMEGITDATVDYSAITWATKPASSGSTTNPGAWSLDVYAGSPSGGVIIYGGPWQSPASTTFYSWPNDSGSTVYGLRIFAGTVTGSIDSYATSIVGSGIVGNFTQIVL